MNRGISHDPGLYCRLYRSWVLPRPAVFLDRDGVLVEDTGYLHRVEQIRAIPGAFSAVARFNRRGWSVIVVTNQSGIARGYYTWKHFGDVQDALEARLRCYGGHFDAVFACAYHEEGQGTLRVPNHTHRKPNPGMLLWATELLKIDTRESCLVGDNITDIQAAATAGLECAVHVNTGHGLVCRDEVRRFAAQDAPPNFKVFYSKDLRGAMSCVTQWRNSTRNL